VADFRNGAAEGGRGPESRLAKHRRSRRRAVGHASGTVVSPEKRRGGILFTVIGAPGQDWPCAAVAAASFFAIEPG
jgi:hypothetical protein